MSMVLPPRASLHCAGHMAPGGTRLVHSGSRRNLMERSPDRAMQAQSITLQSGYQYQPGPLTGQHQVGLPTRLQPRQRASLPRAASPQGALTPKVYFPACLAPSSSVRRQVSPPARSLQAPSSFVHRQVLPPPQSLQMQSPGATMQTLEQLQRWPLQLEEERNNCDCLGRSQHQPPSPTRERERESLSGIRRSVGSLSEAVSPRRFPLRSPQSTPCLQPPSVTPPWAMEAGNSLPAPPGRPSGSSLPAPPGPPTGTRVLAPAAASTPRTAVLRFISCGPVTKIVLPRHSAEKRWVFGGARSGADLRSPPRSARASLVSPAPPSKPPVSESPIGWCDAVTPQPIRHSPTSISPPPVAAQWRHRASVDDGSFQEMAKRIPDSWSTACGSVSDSCLLEQDAVPSWPAWREGGGCHCASAPCQLQDESYLLPVAKVAKVGLESCHSAAASCQLQEESIPVAAPTGRVQMGLAGHHSAAASSQQQEERAPLAAPTGSAKVALSVRVPEGSKDGTVALFEYCGQEFEVPVPTGKSPGESFRADVCVDAAHLEAMGQGSGDNGQEMEVAETDRPRHFRRWNMEHMLNVWQVVSPCRHRGRGNSFPCKYWFGKTSHNGELIRDLAEALCVRIDEGDWRALRELLKAGTLIWLNEHEVKKEACSRVQSRVFQSFGVALDGGLEELHVIPE
eukprot:TRINITY_DN45799_c0_g1_i1.p1 TRINITY_DN45799_c0_g1~~TRINITY_DN45799_c0_g1_i1.p1  ORF type:complete len:681 (-),score=84.51 TRINITY_DN45799_c0_g1_i1:60-2102(-)